MTETRDAADTREAAETREAADHEVRADEQYADRRCAGEQTGEQSDRPRVHAPAWRRTLRRLRRTPERLLHPLRRRRAERLAAGARGPVVVLCHGNICRSPYAEASLRTLLAGRGIEVASAGFIGPGRPSPAVAQEVAAARGHDLAAHRAQLLTAEMARSAGLVVVMNERQRTLVRARFAPEAPVAVLGDFDPEPVETREIMDPIGRDHTCFSLVYDRIDRCASSLAAVLGTAASRG